MEDQVLIWYLYRRLFAFPVTQQVNTPDKRGIEAKFDVDYLTFPFIAVIKLAFSGGSFLFILGESYTIKRHLYQAACT